MKTVELFCASPASTAICSSMDQRKMIRRAIKSNDHHHHHGSSNRHHHGGLPKPPSTTNTTKTRTITVPCNSSQIPYSPSHSAAQLLRRKYADNLTRRKSSADVSDVSSAASPPPRTTSSRYLLSDNPIFDFSLSSDDRKTDDIGGKYSNDFPVFRSSSSIESPCAKKSSLLNDIIAYKASLVSSFNTNNGDTPKESSSDTTKDHPLIDYKTSSSPTRMNNSELVVTYKSSNDTSRNNKLVEYSGLPRKISKEMVASVMQCTKELTPAPLNTTSSAHNQVVELKVSIHCRGCEGKIKKHISRMEGVTSYSIDLATKKVTIAGNVTPLGVLSSVSKVKYAEFWSSPTSSSSSTSSASSPRITMDL